MDGDLELAQARVEEGTAIARRGNWPYLVSLSASNLGDLAQSRGDRQWAIVHDRASSAIPEHLGAERFAAAYRSGARLSLEEVAGEVTGRTV